MIGLMQGRTLPRYKGLYQAFPLNYWEAEFFIAKELGFTHIEFVVDYADYLKSPLFSKQGIEKIKEISLKSGIFVSSICADYFMAAPLHFEEFHQESLSSLETLIESAAELGAKDLVIPCVDQSSVTNKEQEERLRKSLVDVLPLAQAKGIFINLEADFAPKRFADFLSSVNSSFLKVNYDIGNSASLGFNPEEEFEFYGDKISDLHIKDRTRGGGSVLLGTGDANFPLVFSLLKKYDFKGNIVMQASRAESYQNEIPHLLKQKEFITPYVKDLRSS